MATNPVIVKEGMVGLLMTPKFYTGLGVSVIDLTLADLIHPIYGLVYPITGNGISLKDALSEGGPFISNNMTRIEFVITPEGNLFVTETYADQEGEPCKVAYNSLPSVTATYLLANEDHPNLDPLNAIISLAKTTDEINHHLSTNLLTQRRLYHWFTYAEIMAAIKKAVALYEECTA